MYFLIISFYLSLIKYICTLSMCNDIYTKHEYMPNSCRDNSRRYWPSKSSIDDIEKTKHAVRIMSKDQYEFFKKVESSWIHDLSGCERLLIEAPAGSGKVKCLQSFILYE